MRWTELIRRSRPARPSTSSDLGQWIEAVLLVMLLVQVARLLWAVVTPVGLFGDWRAREPVVVGADARNALFAGFDPFFRTGVTVGPGDAPAQQVTSLPLRLYGIRVNEASGLGSAIIANEGGEQASYAVGEEIAPGVRLKSVAFDHVIIERGGASETLFIDQSDEGEAASNAAAPAVGPQPAGSGSGTAPGAGGPITPDAMRNAVGLVPRLENGRVTGIVPSSTGGSAAFAQAGFRPGDIIVQINGQSVRSADAINDLQNAIRPGGRVSLMVERGAATVPINIILPESR